MENVGSGCCKELSSLNDMDTFFPVDTETLIKDQHVKVISSPMFSKEKCDGSIKGITCAIGTPQRAYIKKEDTASPTCVTESVFITSVVDAHERCHITTFDVPTRSLHAVTDKDIFMRLEGRLAEMMVKVDPSLYRKYITTGSKG